MIQPVNWKMVSHPLNWIIILLMLIIAGTAGHLVLTFLGVNPSTDSTTVPANGVPAGQRPGGEVGAISPASVGYQE